MNKCCISIDTFMQFDHFSFTFFKCVFVQADLLNKMLTRHMARGCIRTASKTISVENERIAANPIVLFINE